MAKGSGSGKTPERLVEYINKAIAEKGQKAFELEVGLSTSMISRYKRGIGEPTAATLQKFADYFGVSVPVLRGEGIFSESNFEKETGLTIPDWISVYDKFCYFTNMEFEAALEETGLFGTSMHFIHIAQLRAKELLRTPEDFYNNCNKDVWLRLTQLANKVIEKYKTMLAQCDEETRNYFLSRDTDHNHAPAKQKAIDNTQSIQTTSEEIPIKPKQKRKRIKTSD